MGYDLSVDLFSAGLDDDVTYIPDGGSPTTIRGIFKEAAEDGIHAGQGVAPARRKAQSSYASVMVQTSDVPDVKYKDKFKFPAPLGDDSEWMVVNFDRRNSGLTKILIKQKGRPTTNG